MSVADERPLLTAGVVADTHIPDRVAALPEGLLAALGVARVDLILHAGDVCSAGVLAEFGQVAPVTAVRGNRDLLLTELPWSRRLTLGGVAVGLAHGHGSFWHYLKDKIKYTAHGYQFERYRQLLAATFPEAAVVVFGHTHQAEIRRLDGRLYLNPGPAVGGPGLHRPPSFALLRVFPGQRVEAEIIKDF